MTVRIRFFARFREFFGPEIFRDYSVGMMVASLVKEIALTNPEGYSLLFDGEGNLREFVIIMQNGKRIERTDATHIPVADRDEIAVFPPVAGG